MKKRILLYFALIILIFNPLFINCTELKKLVMCRPLVSQIKNIVIMQELGILPVKKMKLLCVYHEDELTSYASSKKFVKSEGLRWVSFKKIEGSVPVKDLFKKNRWSHTFSNIIKNSDGIIFTGGMDIPANIYGEKNSLLTEPSTPFRSYYEISFLFHLIGRGKDSEFVPILENNKDYPVLAICLGEQSMNVAAGGTLIQDIPSEIYKVGTIEDVVKMDPDKIHSSRYIKALHPDISDLFSHFHKIKLKKTNIFYTAGIRIDNMPYVISSHHQSAGKIGVDLNIIATSMDGKIVEALEHTKFKNVLGVQFHPEVYKLYTKRSLYRKIPSGEIDFSPYKFLTENNRSMEFHLKLWKWFCEKL